MRNENIETTELSDAELDGVSGGLLDGAMTQLGSTVEGLVGADLGGIATNLGGVSVDPSTGIAPVTGINL